MMILVILSSIFCTTIIVILINLFIKFVYKIDVYKEYDLCFNPPCIKDSLYTECLSDLDKEFPGLNKENEIRRYNE